MDQQIRVLVTSGISGPDQQTRKIVRLLIKADGATDHATTCRFDGSIVRNVLQPEDSTCGPETWKEVHQATICWRAYRHSFRTHSSEATADIIRGVVGKKDDTGYWKSLRDTEGHLSQSYFFKKSAGDLNHRFFRLQDDNSLGKKMRNSCMKN